MDQLNKLKDNAIGFARNKLGVQVPSTDSMISQENCNTQTLKVCVILLAVVFAVCWFFSKYEILVGKNDVPLVDYLQFWKRNQVKTRGYLVSENFDHKPKDNVVPVEFIYFSMPGCGHCIRFNKSNIWNLLKVKYANEHHIKFNEYNTNDNPDQIKKHNIKGFPTILAIKKGQTIQYTGPRDYDDMEAWTTSVINEIMKYD